MRLRNRALICCLAIALPILALADGLNLHQGQDEPRLGQQGKDVIWVPTPPEVVEAVLDMAAVVPGDYVIDLGSGDGRIVIAAAKRGVRALGIEYNPKLVEFSQDLAQKAGVSARASFVQGDIFQSDFSHATVITLYLLPDLNLKLRPKILTMKPGTRVVSHTFSMDAWQADRTTFVAGRKIYLWIVPAKVAGLWIWPTRSGNAQLTMSQSFQKIQGVLRIDGKSLPLKNAHMEGARISFIAGENQAEMHEYAGVVSGNIIQGTAKVGRGPVMKWTSQRQTGR